MLRQELNLRQTSPGMAVILVESKDNFLLEFSKDPYWISIFDLSRIESIVVARNPKDLFVEHLWNSIPLKFISPYDPLSPAFDGRFHGTGF